MKSIAGLLAALLCAASLASAEEAAPAAAPAPALSRVSLGAHLSYWDAKDLDAIDLDGAIGGGIIGQIRLLDSLALELRLSGYGAGSTSDVFIEGQGWYENDTVIVCMPLEAGLVAFLPVGESFRFYGGPGIGYYVFDGEFTTTQGPVETTINMDLDEAAGFYAVFGGRVQLARNAAIFLEGQYTWVETALRREVGPIRADDDLDFSGLSLSAGMIFTF